jgi:dolichol-phosphate mannosyltransferase
MIPTYNERENIQPLIKQLLAVTPRCEILVVDDNSPDGTGQLVEQMMRNDRRIELLTRLKRRGRGSAGIEGFKYALQNGTDYLIEMDADFSHHPRYVPIFLEEMRHYDVALGSRFAPGGEDHDRGVIRTNLTKLASLYVRTLLNIKIRDVSSGYRCFRREVFEKVDLDDMISAGPSIVLEILYKVCLNGFSVKEVPIIFEDRRQGQTKLDIITLLETLVMVLRLRKMHRQGLLFRNNE